MSLAGVTLGAKPGEIGGENFLPHSQKHHTNYFPRIIFGVNISDRATCSAETTGKAKLDVLPTRFLGHLILKFGILLI